MKSSIPVAETIQKRHSVPTYEERTLLPQDRAALMDCMNQLNNPFDVQVKKYITDKKLSADGEKLGTYGVIKGELFPAISPVGYPAAKHSLTETLMRSTMKSSSQKEWTSLFYQKDFLTPLTSPWPEPMLSR